MAKGGEPVNGCTCQGHRTGLFTQDQSLLPSGRTKPEQAHPRMEYDLIEEAGYRLLWLDQSREAEESTPRYKGMGGENRIDEFMNKDSWEFITYQTVKHLINV